MKNREILLIPVILLFAAGLVMAGGGRERPEPQVREDRYGGTLGKAFFAPSNLDPAFAATVTDDEICRLWGDFLVYVDENVIPDKSRSLAEDWTVSSDGLRYTFHIRQGVLFHNGKELSAEDVKFTFNRLRDPDVGSAAASLYTDVKTIEATGNYTVVFTLSAANPDFLVNLGAYQAVILHHETFDFDGQNGTGAFIVDSYLPEDRMTFIRNPNYWRYDDDGNRLPYLDGINYLFLAEPSAQVEALRGGQVDQLIYLPTEYVMAVENDPNLEVYQHPSNSHYIIRMRTDREPFNDVRVRQAVRAAVDREEILIGAFEGLGVTGRDTPIGPAYADFYHAVPELERDIPKARRLLDEAGYGSDLEITLITQQASPVPSIATILREQLAEAGITVNIELVPSDVYYGADNLWLNADFAITDWGARATPQTYLDLAYTCDAPWHETHWCDPELDALAAKSAVENDREKRAETFKEIQEIFMDRGPIIVPFFSNNRWGITKSLKGVQTTGYLGTAMDLAQVYFEY